MKIGIIGAGLAGLAAARGLTQAGHDVFLFDKGRGPGGRMSTRRAGTPLGEVRFDHGAQYFTARSEAFRETIAGLRQEGAVADWTPRLADIRRTEAGWRTGVRPAGGDQETMFVGTPGMNGPVRGLAEGLDVSWASRVTAITGEPGRRHLTLDSGDEAGPFDLVVSAMPAEQAADLLQPVSPSLAGQAAAVLSAPCWAAMLAFEEQVPAEWDAASVSGAACAWVARNSSKPGRDEAEAWVIHASPDWSRAHVDDAPDAVIEGLVAEFRNMTGAPAPVHAAAHRWLYARVEDAAGSPFGWDGEARIATVGDWRIAPRVEAAWQSGHAFAEWMASQP